MKKINNKTIWVLFGLSSVVVLIDVFLMLFGLGPFAFFDKFKLYFPPFVVFVHVLYVLNFKRGLFFIFLASVIGFIFEFLGTRYGALLGAGYIYNPNNYDILLFNIPILIPIYWVLFIYTGYSISNSFLIWIEKEKPNIINKNKKLLFKLILFDGLLVTGIDFFMDPLLVSVGNWQWFGEGFYYGIPFLNFVGWFVVTISVTGIFRGVEYFRRMDSRQVCEDIYLIPLIGYFSLFVLFSVMAIQERLYSLILIGALIMIPVLGINVACVLRRKRIL